MRRLLAFTALLALAAPVRASSLNLRWTDCLGDGGAQNRAFACDTNTGSQSVVGSFVPLVNATGVVSTEFLVDFGFDGSSVPAWWTFKNPGTCRLNALIVRPTAPSTAIACTDWASGAALGMLATFSAGFGFPNLARVTGSTTVSSDLAADVFAGQEYFSFQLTILNQKTVGAGACGGCNVGACITLRRIWLRTLGGLHDQYLITGAAPGDQIGDARVLWQLLGPSSSCDVASPARNRTWGEVKALYR